MESAARHPTHDPDETLDQTNEPAHEQPAETPSGSQSEDAVAPRKRNAGFGPKHIIIAATVVAMLAVAAKVFFAKDRADDAVPVAATEAPAATTYGPLPAVATSAGPAFAAEPVTDPVAALRNDLEQYSGEADSLRIRLSEMDREMSTIASTVQAIDARLAKAEEGLATATPQAQDSGDAAADIASIKADLDALSKKVASTNWLARQNAKAVKRAAPAPRQQPPAAALPFTVETVDMWGTTPSMVVRVGGQSQFVSPGQSVAGWEFVSIDQALDTAVFAKEGRRVQVRVPQ